MQEFSIRTSINSFQEKTHKSAKSLVYVAIGPDSAFSLFEQFINSANYSILIAVYEFWSLDLFNLLKNAVARGVRIRLLLENDCYSLGTLETNDQYNRYIAYKFYQLKEQHGYDIEIRLENSSALLHAKFMVIDNNTVIVGSGNFIQTTIPPDPTSIPELGEVHYYTAARNWFIAIKDETVAQAFVNKFIDLYYSSAVDYDPNRDGTGYEITPTGTIYYSPDFTDILVFEVEKVIPVFSPDNSVSELESMLSSANHCVYIQQMYVYETSTGVSDLIDTLKSVHSNKGVTVQFIIEDDFPGNFDDVNSGFTDYGFHVVPAFRYASQEENLFSHVKGIIVDDYLVFIGSINWSKGGLIDNHEAGVIIASGEAGQFFRRVFEHDWNLSSTESFDNDGDGLSNYYEIEHGIDPNNVDTDGDGADDYTEVMILGTDPSTPDVNDTEPPIVEIVNLQNHSEAHSRKITIEWSARDNYGVKVVKIYINGSQIVSTSNRIGEKTVILDVGVWNITAIAEDYAGNKARVCVFISITIQRVSLEILSPTNMSYFDRQGILINWSYPEELGELIEWKVYTNGSLIAEGTEGSSANITLLEGLWNVSIFAKGTDADGFASIYVIVDLEAPEIVILSPSNNTIIKNQNVNITWYVTDNFGIHSVVAYLNGKIISENQSEFSEIRELTKGRYNLTIVANDLAGNIAQKTVIFAVRVEGVKQQYDWVILAVCGVIMLIVAIIIVIKLAKGK